MNVLITGANGYVGSILASRLSRLGMRTVGLTRSGTPRFCLGEPTGPEILVGADALIHCAYDFRAFGRKKIHRVNVEGSFRLFEAAKTAGVKRIIFISSMSAFTGCRSQYGQAKLAVEQSAGRFGLIVVRPGLVWGRTPRGMVGALRKACSIPLITPLPGSGAQMSYLAHEDDLAELINKLLTMPGPPAGRPILAASEAGMTFRNVLELLSESAGARRKAFLPIPAGAIWAGLRGLELIGLRPRLRSDSVVSLLNSEARPDFSATRRLGVSFRPFTAAAAK